VPKVSDLLHPTRALVADDDPDVRALVVESLLADGMTVQEASTGTELLASLAQGGVDILVTDVMMPGLGGVQAAAKARNAGEQIPILVITASRGTWIDDAVRKLQRADVLYKPFSSDELLRRVHALLTPEPPNSTDALREDDEPYVFPPALVQFVRKRVGEGGCLAGISDEILTELLSVIFFAGLEREEGERNSVRVVFVGNGSEDPEPAIDGVPPRLFRWSTLSFTSPRDFCANQLVKLAAASVGSRVFVRVCHREGELVILGLSREGVNIEGDRALKIVVPKAGGLSFRVGRHHLLDYEHGHVQSVAADVILAAGPVRNTLARAASGSGLPKLALERYLETVAQLVATLSAHGSGGILVFSGDAHPTPEGDTGYRTHPAVSLAAMLLRLHLAQSTAGTTGPRTIEQDPLLVGALEADVQHTIAELGALTALDGATILDRSLALVGFGIVLRVVGLEEPVFEAEDVKASAVHEFDLGGRGTRHRAAANYAASHPGSVVFVASQDGGMNCLCRTLRSPRLILWRLGSAPAPNRSQAG
jgi:CheY-like chemotaxis protein